jgi:hypothetical protein
MPLITKNQLFIATAAAVLLPFLSSPSQAAGRKSTMANPDFT